MIYLWILLKIFKSTGKIVKKCWKQAKNIEKHGPSQRPTLKSNPSVGVSKRVCGKYRCMGTQFVFVIRVYIYIAIDHGYSTTIWCHLLMVLNWQCFRLHCNVLHQIGLHCLHNIASRHNYCVAANISMRVWHIYIYIYIYICIYISYMHSDIHVCIRAYTRSPWWTWCTLYQIAMHLGWIPCHVGELHVSRNKDEPNTIHTMPTYCGRNPAPVGNHW